MIGWTKIFALTYHITHKKKLQVQISAQWLTLLICFPRSLWNWKFDTLLLYCKWYLVTQCESSGLPCVATRVTLNCVTKSIWSHWLASFFDGSQTPPLFALAWLWSLALEATWRELYLVEALICPSVIARLSMPRAPLHSKREPHFKLVYEWVRLNSPLRVII